MTTYLLKRILHGLISIIIVVAVVMILVYSLIDKTMIFSADPVFSKKSTNEKVTYQYAQWEKYGYLDYVTYEDFINLLIEEGTITEADKEEAIKIAQFAADGDNETAAKCVKLMKERYEAKGYTVTRLDAVKVSPLKLMAGGKQVIFAYKNINVFVRLVNYFGKLFYIDNKYNASGIADSDRSIYVTMHDPLYEGKFAPAIMGNGTDHKYLLYFDNVFPFIHQNLFTIRLGLSYSVNKEVDVFKTMTQKQGTYVKRMQTYPTGFQEESADNLHSATYSEGSLDSNFYSTRFTDEYTNTEVYKNGSSRMGYSFVIGIIATILTYLIGVPLGIIMARHKDGVIDKIGTVYIIFIIAVPSLAYIFMFKAIGGAVLGLPTTFNVDSLTTAMYILPIISLALPSIAGIMKWLRRYMIDQMNSDYVKFARSGGLSEGEIFRKHIAKNALIPIVHGVPGALLGSLTGALVTERVYLVPGIGNVLTKAINNYDNSVIVGITLFYAVLSVTSIILGDVFISLIDPRISFVKKGRN